MLYAVLTTLLSSSLFILYLCSPYCTRYNSYTRITLNTLLLPRFSMCSRFVVQWLPIVTWWMLRNLLAIFPAVRPHNMVDRDMDILFLILLASVQWSTISRDFDSYTVRSPWYDQNPVWIVPPGNTYLVSPIYLLDGRLDQTHRSFILVCHWISFGENAKFSVFLKLSRPKSPSGSRFLT